MVWDTIAKAAKRFVKTAETGVAERLYYVKRAFYRGLFELLFMVLSLFFLIIGLIIILIDLIPRDFLGFGLFLIGLVLFSLTSLMIKLRP